MKTLLKIETDSDSTIVSGEVHTKEEMGELALALANLFLTEDELSEAVLNAINLLLKNDNYSEQENQEPIVIDIQSLINNKHKS